jgi:UDP-N-acetylmuramoylalanine--D-glutamate ligase
METVRDYRGKTVLVVGAGRSGLAAARFLIDREARVILTDSKNRSELDAALEDLVEMARDSGRLELELGGHRPGSFTHCDLAVVSPGVPLALSEFELCRKAGIPVIAEIELASRHLKGRIIGITGSNGKTTTTTLVSELLSGAGMRGFAAGNIGIPLTGFVAESTERDFYAVELSSFQLESIGDFRPWIGAILNLSPDHQDRYSDYEDYVAAKRRIFMNQEPSDYAVLNADDPGCAAIAPGLKATVLEFSRLKPVRHGTFVREGLVAFRSPDMEKELFPVTAIGLQGIHNLENVLAACAMAIPAGVPPESLEESVRKFKGVEHRIEYVAEIDGVRYYNDSKATNVDAAVKAIESFPGNILLIAGGRDKGSDFSRMRNPVRQRVKRLVLIGEAADTIRRALCKDVEISSAGTMREAVGLCRQHAQPGDIVLLAPACASFDMFRNYEDRGRVFKAAVRAEE